MSVLMALALLKREKVVKIMMFTIAPGVLEPLDLTKDMTFEQAMKFCESKQIAKSMQDIYVPLRVARTNKTKTDIFITFVDSVARSIRNKIVSHTDFKAYQKDLNLKNTRYIVCSLSRFSSDLKIEADNTVKEKNMLEICGFNLLTPKIIDAYCKHLFN